MVHPITWITNDSMDIIYMKWGNGRYSSAMEHRGGAFSVSVQSFKVAGPEVIGNWVTMLSGEFNKLHFPSAAFKNVL